MTQESNRCAGCDHIVNQPMKFAHGKWWHQVCLEFAQNELNTYLDSKDRQVNDADLAHEAIEDHYTPEALRARMYRGIDVDCHSRSIDDKFNRRRS